MPLNRIVSIDVFRALTMILMVWVNDFWTLNSIPKYLKHAANGEDYLGFSDVIFPWFLFAMGMSIPFAFEDRIKTGESLFIIWIHIALRSIALLVMGLFHMNMEMYNHDTSFFTKPIYVIISTSAFFLIWNAYPKTYRKNQNLFNVLRVSGILILMGMFLSFSGKSYEGQEIGFETHWWGILGLIGWVYLIVGSTFLFMKNSIFGSSIALLICIGLNLIQSSGISYNIFSWQSDHWIPGSGGLQAMSFGGVIVSLFLIENRKKQNVKRLYASLFVFGIISLVVGLYLRNFFVINKILGTPSWVLVSLATGIFLYIFLHWVSDVNKILNWYKYIEVAGTATLTCYIIPYFFYSFRTLSGIVLPEFLRTGFIGLIKSFIFSLIIVGICWVLKKNRIQLKI